MGRGWGGSRYRDVLQIWPRGISRRLRQVSSGRYAFPLRSRTCGSLPGAEVGDCASGLRALHQPARPLGPARDAARGCTLKVPRCARSSGQWSFRLAIALQCGLRHSICDCCLTSDRVANQSS